MNKNGFPHNSPRINDLGLSRASGALTFDGGGPRNGPGVILSRPGSGLQFTFFAPLTSPRATFLFRVRTSKSGNSSDLDAGGSKCPWDGHGCAKKGCLDSENTFGSPNRALGGPLGPRPKLSPPPPWDYICCGELREAQFTLVRYRLLKYRFLRHRFLGPQSPLGLLADSN